MTTVIKISEAQLPQLEKNMTPQDRELFNALTRRHALLEESLATLKADLKYLEQRADLVEAPAQPAVAVPPPLPPTWEENAPVTPPPISDFVRAEKPAEVPPLPPLPPPPEVTARAEEKPLGLEFQFGRWLARIGVVLALITLISFSTLAYEHFYKFMGPWSKLAILALVSGGLIAVGFWLERKFANLLVYGRTVAGGGLACLYYTLYGATYVRQLHVISSPLLGGFLLLGWSAWVLYLAEKRKSELLSVFAIALAYFSSAITPVGDFTMVANLILAATAVIFLLRNSWTGLSYLCLAGTYAGYLRQIVVYNGNIEVWFEFIHLHSFWPGATYLAGAWIIFTAGVFLATTPKFAAGKRMAFLCLNNGAFIGLLLVDANLSAFGHLGGILCTVGGLFLAASLAARITRSSESDLAGAYLTQGLALATGGIVIAYTGVTRGLLITIESVFLAAAGAYSRNIILRIGGGLSALLGSLFLVFEIGFENHYPWTLTFCGAVAMLANAWFARREFWREPREVANARFVWSSAFYTVLGLIVLLTGIVAQPNDNWVAPGLAIATLLLTLAVYLIPLFELPALSQGLLLIGQFIAFFPFDDQTHAPHWSPNIVAIITMFLVTRLPRQKLVRTSGWLQPLTLLYALAMVGFSYNAVHPHASEQTWMIVASLLSLVFLAYGAFTRSWQFIVSGQIFLAISVYTFLTPPGFNFAWTWWSAAFPPATVFLTAWLARRWLPSLLGVSDVTRETLHWVARLYQSVAIGLLIRWVFGVVPSDDVTFTLFALGTGAMLWNLIWPSSYGVRTSFVLSAVGVVNYFASHNIDAAIAFTWPNAFGFLLFLAQPALLRRWGRELVTEAESWAVILLSTAMAWFFVSTSILAANSTNLTLGWALFAIALVLIGFAANERRQRWCGLVVLAAAIVRVGVHDFWLFSDVSRVLTFFVLTVVCLGLSFLYYKFADRLKEWL